MDGNGIPWRAPARGWWLFFVLAALVSANSLRIGAGGSWDVEAVRHVVRATAQMSLGLFSTAFAASALFRLWPNVLTRFIRIHRRYFGLSFAFSHLVHAIALWQFAQIAPHEFAGAADLAMFVFGGLAYVFIAAMAFTSFDRTASWIGPRAWVWLHRLGSYDIWLTFLVAEGKRALHDAYYVPFVAVLVAVMVLRLSAATAKAAAH